MAEILIVAMWGIMVAGIAFLSPTCDEPQTVPSPVHSYQSSDYPTKNIPEQTWNEETNGMQVYSDDGVQQDVIPMMNDADTYKEEDLYGDNESSDTDEPDGETDMEETRE